MTLRDDGDDDGRVEEEDDVEDDDDDGTAAAAFPNDPRGSSLHAPVSKMGVVVASAGLREGADEDFEAASATTFETSAAIMARPLAPRNPTRATSSTVLGASSAQTIDDDKGRADFASLRANETSLARQASVVAVVDD